ncbi:MAG TPA: trypsin-like peptidase domain-containing protein [Clostridia bacterium]|nr:trypsin-like peptidase domain-containing protein [Clostridia bacterium]
MSEKDDIYTNEGTPDTSKPMDADSIFDAQGQRVDDSADMPHEDNTNEPASAENQQERSEPQQEYYGQSYPPSYKEPYVHPQQGTPPPFYYGKPAGQAYNTPPAYSQPAQYGQPIPQTKGKKTGLKVFFSILAALLVFSLVVSGVAIGKNLAPTVKDDISVTTGSGPSLQIQETPAASNDSPAQGAGLNGVTVAKKVKPSVLAILVYTENGNFGNQNKSVVGEGTGIVMGMDESGEYTYIVTCAHVISDKGVNISIQLEDGTQHKAELVGFDLRTDVGVIKVKMKNLKAAEFGNSEALEVGEQVFAVGNPGGAEFYGSVTLGIVSAIDRPVNSEIGYTMELIQHDAAINPGNSGGALVNASGQVVGINSLKIIANEYEGMGFAIPITSAKVIVDNIIKYGYVPNRPKLGITYYAASSNRTYSMLVQIKGLPSGSLYINDISPDSELAKTDAKKGDLIIAVNGKNLDTSSVLLEVIDKGKVGDTLTLKLCRVSQDYQISEFTVKVKLVEDKGITSQPTETEPETTTDPFDYFFNPFN